MMIITTTAITKWDCKANQVFNIQETLLMIFFETFYTNMIERSSMTSHFSGDKSTIISIELKV